jgi:tetratricopeptide (TPR) repeat protein
VSFFPQRGRRRIVPRWRKFQSTAEAGELSVKQEGSRLSTPQQSLELTRRVSDWQEQKSIGVAADLLNVASAHGQLTQAKEAAEYVLAQSDTSESLRDLAREALGLPLHRIGRIDDTEPDQYVRGLRRRLACDPHDAIAWADLAREYARLGKEDASKRAVRTALGLAPQNRFILRAAARLYVHFKEWDFAHSILRRTPRTRFDPWLLAAEIAIASGAGRTSRNLRDARELMASGRFSAFDLAELASALATEEMNADKVKNARQLFNRSLVSPNDNVVAQATWAAERLPGFSVERKLLQTPRSFEARAWEHYVGGNWAECLAEAQRWLCDEPYASRPAVLAGFVASAILDQYDLALSIERRALKASPSDNTLLNNVAVNLARTGRVEDAEAAFNRIDVAKIDADDRAPLVATRGLIEFRKGNVELGRSLYRTAIDDFISRDQLKRKALALLYLASEEIDAKTDRAVPAFNEAQHAVQAYSGEDLKAVLANLESKLPRYAMRVGQVR